MAAARVGSRKVGSQHLDDETDTPRLGVLRAQNARLLLRNSKFGEPTYLQAEEILFSGGDYGTLLNSYTYWQRVLEGMTDPLTNPPPDE